MPTTHRTAGLQLAHDGVLTRTALRSGGLNPSLGDRLVREAGALRAAPSTYLLSVEDAAPIAAAHEHAGDDLVVIGLLACRLLGVTDAPGSVGLDVLVPAGRRRVSTSSFASLPRPARPGSGRMRQGRASRIRTARRWTRHGT